MKTRMLQAAMAAAFLAMGAASLQAETTGPAGAFEIHVINNHTSAVQVYVEDSFGRMRSIGWVNRSDAKVLTVPAQMTELGAVQIKVFPDEPVWSPRAVPDGVSTMPLNLKAGDVVDFWVETELADSYLQIVRT
jgi:hypothetical protein